MVEGIVTEPEEVSNEWLTEALRRSGAIVDASVVSYTTQAVGTGQVGHNVRFTLTYDRAEPTAPTTIVCKFPSPDETSRATGISIGTYEKEAHFYRELASTVDIRIPFCHHVEFDPDARLATLVMEDLAPAVQGDQITGCDIDQAALVVDQLAALHAPRWGDPSLLDIAWIGRPSQESIDGIAGFYSALWPGFLERFGSRLSDVVREVGQQFGERLTHWATRRLDGPLTIVHGDFRLDNMLFGPAADGSETVTTVDWQTLALGIGPDDLSYFIGAGLVPEARRAGEAELVRRYHDGLVARGVTGYDFEDCWEDYCRFSYSGLQMAVIASMIVRADERGDAMFLAMAERHAAQAVDLDAARFL